MLDGSHKANTDSRIEFNGSECANVICFILNLFAAKRFCLREELRLRELQTRVRGEYLGLRGTR